MFNLDPGKLLIIGVVAIMVLGPDKLPRVARQVGGTWRSFNDFRGRMETEIRSNIPDFPSVSDIAQVAKSPTALLNHLSNLSPGDTSDEPSELAHVWDAVGQRVEADSGSSPQRSPADASALASDPSTVLPDPEVPLGDASLN